MLLDPRLPDNDDWCPWPLAVVAVGVVSWCGIVIWIASWVDKFHGFELYH